MNDKWTLPLGVAALLVAAAVARMIPGVPDGRAPERRGLPAAWGPQETPKAEPAVVDRPPIVIQEPPSEAQEAAWPAFRKTLEELSRTREQAGDREYRRSVLAETTRFLEMDASTALAFDATRQVVQADLERIQRDMGQVFAIYPDDLPDQELQRIQSEVERLFEADRRRALGRLEAFLGEGESHRQFREILEDWTMDSCRTP